MAQRLKARVLQWGQVQDASQLFHLAKTEYLRLRGSLMPQLPDFDAKIDEDGSAAVELCLKVRTGRQDEHVDRALFNLVSGSAAALEGLHFDAGHARQALGIRASAAVVVIPGMTSALLLAAADGSVHMPPKHRVDLAHGELSQCLHFQQGPCQGRGMHAEG